MMEKKDLLKKQELAEELGMKFDEAAELFSEETLCTMQMGKVSGKWGIDVKVGCEPKGACTNNCPSLNVCIDIYCPFGGEEPTQTPIELKWEGCPTIEPPTPPTVQQDAICWQEPPIESTK